MSPEMASTPALPPAFEQEREIPAAAPPAVEATSPETSAEAASGVSDASAEKPKQELDMVEMGISFVSPALFGKLCLLYFGSMYSAHPGKGYGIGLVISILFTLTMLGRFAWRYRHYSED